MREENIDFIVSNNIETNLKELDRGLKCLHKFKQIEQILDDSKGYKIFRFIRYVTNLKKFQQEFDIDSLFEPSGTLDLFTEILSNLAFDKNDLNFENCSRNFNLKVGAEYLVYNLGHEHIFIKWTKTPESICCGGRLYGQCESNLKQFIVEDSIYKCTICHEYNLCQACFDSPRNDTNLNEQRIFILDDLLTILNNLLPFSIQLRLHLLDNLRIFIDFLSDNRFVKNCHNYNSNMIFTILSIINWLSKQCDDKFEWKRLNSVNIILNMLDLSSKFGQLIYNTIAYIIDDEQIENLTSLVQTMIEIDVKRLNKFASNFKKDNKLTRLKQQFRDENEKLFLHEVMVMMTKLGQVSLTDSLQNVFKLAINPTLKYEIFNKNNFKKSLKIIIKHGNEIEKFFSILLLTQLAFDSKVINDLINDSRLITMIKKISKCESIELRKLRIVSKQLLWLVEEVTYPSNVTSSPSNPPEHIMISYDSSNKELCLRIKSELERENNRVWIDSNGVHGSGLDSMAQAVAKSKCVLICVDEKYRQSINCQAEALYSLKSNKLIIPLIIQKGYENVKGWLGEIINHRNYVDFTNRNFNENIIGLKIKLEDLFSKQSQLLESSSLCLKVKAASTINEWSEKDVENWFKLTNLNNTFIHFALCPCNGKLLYQLRQMQMHAPEFFFKSVSPKSLNINDLKTIALFSLELNELFSNEN